MKKLLFYIIILILPLEGICYTYTRYLTPPYDDATYWRAPKGLSDVWVGYNKKSGAIAVYSYSGGGAAAGSARFYKDFYVPVQSSITAKPLIVYIGGTVNIGFGSFSGTKWQWVVNNRSLHEVDIDWGLSWDVILFKAIDLATLVLGGVVPQGTTLAVVVDLFDIMNNAAQLESALGQFATKDEANEYEGKCTFTVPAGWHRIGVGIRTDASGCITGMGNAIMMGQLERITLEITPEEYTAPPDFTIEDIELSDPEPRVDKQLTFNIGINNIGKGVADMDKIQFYLNQIDGPWNMTRDFGGFNICFSPATTHYYSMKHTFTSRGRYYLRAKADPYSDMPELDETNNILEKYVWIKGHPPNKPQKPWGFPTDKIMLRNKTYRIYTSTTDPDNDPVMYLFHIRNSDGSFEYIPGIDSEYQGWDINGSVVITPTTENGLAVRQAYYVKSMAVDNEGFLSDWSDEEIFHVWYNSPPTKPDISGSTYVYTNDTPAYTVSSTDEEEDLIYYRFNWGDGTPITNWKVQLPSQSSITVNHKYATPGTWTLQVQAQDENNSQSGWASQTVKSVVYVPPSGSIEVCTNSSAASFNIYSGGALKYTGSGTHYTTSAPTEAGYTIYFNNITGFHTPSTITDYLYPGGSLTFTGTYTHQTGTIHVTTNLPGASFSLKGGSTALGENYEGSGAYWAKTGAYAGPYVIWYNPVSGFCLPPTNRESKQVNSYGNTYFTGNYILPPVADLDFYTTNSFVIMNEDVVEFDGSGSYNPNSGMGISRYFFSFGDSKRAYAETSFIKPDGAFDGKTNHVFIKTGTFEPSLTVTDDYGNTAKDTAGTIQVKARPVAHIMIDPSPAILGETIGFYGSAEDEDGDSITGYEWSSNIDGVLSTNQNFSLDNISEGIHSISLRVKDSDNLWSEDTVEFLTVFKPRQWDMFKKDDIRHSSQAPYWNRLYGLLDYATSWTYPTGGFIMGSPVTANLDGNYKNGLEIAFASMDGNLYVTDKNGAPLWSKPIGTSISTPAIGELNSGGPLCVVVGSANGVYAFDNMGNPVWPSAFQSIPPGSAFDSTPVIADINGNPSDGKEIVIGCNDGNVYAINSSGSLRWNYPSPLPAPNQFIGSPAVADIDTNLMGLETAIGSMDGSLYVLDTTGTLVTSWAALGAIQTTPAIANVVPNPLAHGGLETNIVFGSDDGHVYCLFYSSGTLTLSWQYPKSSALLPVRSSPAIAVVGEGGGLGSEVIFGCDNGTVYDLNGMDGILKTSFNCVSGMVRSTCAIANIDTIHKIHPTKGDLSEVVFGSTNGKLYGISFALGGADLLWSPISIAGGQPIFSSPALSDIDHDPDMEILIGADDGQLHMIWAPKNPALIPIAEFSGMPLSGNAPLSVDFTDQSTNSPVQWLWGFGDGLTTATQNPSHIYQNPGQYTVTLSASNAHGKGSITKNNYITVTTPPTADFTHTPESGTAPLTVLFTDQSQNSPSSWLWDFGDTGSSMLQSPSHIYTQPGVYDVSLTVTNSNGADAVTKTGCVLVMAQDPVADFSQDATTGRIPLTVNFTDLSTGNPDSWSWNFGDGGSSPLANPSHTYYTPGYYMVSLTVSNFSGSDTKTNPVTITALPQTDSVMIGSVPDINQPPTQTLFTTIPSNFCAPISAENIAESWDRVKRDPNARAVNDSLSSGTTCEYIGYFMDTNNTGSPHRGNGSDAHSGTYCKDIEPGMNEFARWDAGHLFDAPPASPPILPPQKIGYDWITNTDYTQGWSLYKEEIDLQRPVVVSFLYWNPLQTGITLLNPATGEEIEVFSWGAEIANAQMADPQNPEEVWNLLPGEIGIGHAVTGVGYIESWDPDDTGPLPQSDFAVVHDNWETTPRNVAVPWQNWSATISAVVTIPPTTAKNFWNLY